MMALDLYENGVTPRGTRDGVVPDPAQRGSRFSSLRLQESDYSSRATPSGGDGGTELNTVDDTLPPLDPTGAECSTGAYECVGIVDIAGGCDGTYDPLDGADGCGGT
jgi:hypothetical protein